MEIHKLNKFKLHVDVIFYITKIKKGGFKDVNVLLPVSGNSQE